MFSVEGGCPWFEAQETGGTSGYTLVCSNIIIIVVIFIFTKSYAALRMADLEWIVGLGYISGRYILEKYHEKPIWNHENHENQPGTMKN